MLVKVIAIGNRIMGDDGVAVRVAEELIDPLQKLGVEVMIGETDLGYIESKLEEGEFLLILDAMQTGVEPGSVALIPLDTLKGQWLEQYSQHQLNLLNLVQNCSFAPTGFLMGIEVQEVNFGTELSKLLEDRFEAIVAKVLEIVVMTAELLQGGRS